MPHRTAKKYRTIEMTTQQLDCSQWQLACNAMVAECQVHKPCFNLFYSESEPCHAIWQ